MAERTSQRVEERRSATGSRVPEGSSRLLYLIIVALALLAMLLHLLPNDLKIRAEIEKLKAPLYRAQEARRLAALMSSDPRLGTVVTHDQSGPDNPLRRVLRRAAPGRNATVLLFTGPCSSCIEKDLTAWRHLVGAHGGRSLVVVSRDTPEGISKFARTTRFPLPIVPDPEGSLSKLFNAVWVPRAYVLGTDGRLTWIQKDPQMAVETVGQQVWHER